MNSPRSLAALVALAALATAASAGDAAYAAPAPPAPPTTYTTKYDGVKIDDILNNDRLRNQYLVCLLEDKDEKCTPDAKELKQIIPDALATECSKCSESQKKKVEKVIRFLAKNKPEDWKKLKAKYDPEGKYSARYDDLAKEKGIEGAK